MFINKLHTKLNSFSYGREERLSENGVTLIPSRTFILSRLHVITLHISWTAHVVITFPILSLRTARIRESCFVQPIHCFASLLMSHLQIPYLQMIWPIILATILYRRVNVSMTHWTPFSHLSLLMTMTMLPQITWAHAQTVLILMRANVQSSQTLRPWHKTKFLRLLERQPWNLVLSILHVHLWFYRFLMCC